MYNRSFPSIFFKRFDDYVWQINTGAPLPGGDSREYKLRKQKTHELNSNEAFRYAPVRERGTYLLRLNIHANRLAVTEPC